MRCLRKGCVLEAASSSNYCREHQMLPELVRKFAGSVSLTELAQNLTAEEQVCSVALLRVEREKDYNVAYFRPTESQDSPIVLIEVKLGSDAQTLKAQQLAEGKKFIFQGYVLVNNKDTEILAFR